MRNLLLLTAAVAALSAGAAQATVFTQGATDDTGDLMNGILATNLDLTGIIVNYDDANQIFRIDFSTAGPISSGVAGDNYVLGVNTGAGAKAPFSLQGQGNVRFDKTFVLKLGFGPSDPNISVSAFNGDSGLEIGVPLSSLAASVPGFDPIHYSFNIWSRHDNTLADFVPENRMLSAVPEPASWALMIAGFGLTGAAMRRGRKPERRGAPG